MHFCNVCSNMYYIRLDAEDPNKLVYYCRKCKTENKLLAAENVCIAKTYIKKVEQNFSNIINKHTKLDPTLPRINNVLCPNPNCQTNTDSGAEREIIYIRYDDTNMKYVYLCSTCETVWQTNQKL